MLLLMTKFVLVHLF